ncbi:MAG: hypothetical protein IJR45_06445 [Firmicutes bacterium]|nr:hypothetical protein [Bacillota bacterium]MBQ9605035.1 hypothetical protein [Bacillota bacterium]
MDKNTKKTVFFIIFIFFAAVVDFMMSDFGQQTYAELVFANRPSTKAYYVPEEIFLSAKYTYVYNTEEEFEEHKEWSKTFNNPPDAFVAPDKVKEFCDIMNELELVRIEDWLESINRRMIFARRENHERLHISAFVKKGADDIVYLSNQEGECKDNEDSLLFFDRYIQTITPWDGTERTYYIKNYEENEDIVKRLSALFDKEG